MGIRVKGRISPRGIVKFGYSAPPPTIFPPVFTVSPSINPTSGFTAFTEFTGNDGEFQYGSVTSREWVLDGQVVGTLSTYTPTQPGRMFFRVTITGPDGTTTASSGTVLVTDADPPVWTVDPSISPNSGIMGDTFTGNDGEFQDGTVQSRQWWIGGEPIPGQTSSVYVSDRIGQLTYRVILSGIGGTAQAVSQPVTISVNPQLFNPPVWNSAGYLGSFLEFDPVNIQLEIDDPDNNIDEVTVMAGIMPAGLTVDATGLISGTLENVPETTNYNFTLRATDTTGLFAEAEFSIQVQNVSSVVVWETPPGEIADVGIGGNVDQQLSATSQP